MEVGVEPLFFLLPTSTTLSHNSLHMQYICLAPNTAHSVITFHRVVLHNYSINGLIHKHMPHEQLVGSYAFHGYLVVLCPLI